MICKRNSKKFSLLLVASLLAAVPATTQAGFGKAALFGAAGLGSSFVAWDYTNYSYSLIKDPLYRWLFRRPEEGLWFYREEKEWLKYGALALAVGTGAYLCFKKAYKELVAKKKKKTEKNC